MLGIILPLFSRAEKLKPPVLELLAVPMLRVPQPGLAWMGQALGLVSNPASACVLPK